MSDEDYVEPETGFPGGAEAFAAASHEEVESWAIEVVMERLIRNAAGHEPTEREGEVLEEAAQVLLSFQFARMGVEIDTIERLFQREHDLEFRYGKDGLLIAMKYLDGQGSADIKIDGNNGDVTVKEVSHEHDHQA